MKYLVILVKKMLEKTSVHFLFRKKTVNSHMCVCVCVCVCGGGEGSNIS